MLKLFSCFKANNDDDRMKHKENKKDNNREKNIFGFFLLGNDESGKTKIIEELADEHDPFTREEKILKIAEIERYIRDSLTDILRAFKQTNSSAQLEYPENQQRITYMLTTAHKNDFDYPVEFFEHVETIWADSGLQVFLEKSNTYRVPESARYFLLRVNAVSDPNYFPSTNDMVHSRLFSSQVFKKVFEIEGEGVRFNLLELNLFEEEQQELIQSFHNKANTIIFITDCSSFDEVINETTSQTRLHQSIDLYKMVRNNKLLEKTPVILLLNKQDRLANKIKNGVRLEDYFPDFANYVFPGVDTDSINFNEDSEVTRAKHFIEQQFLSINFNNCHHHFTCDNNITVRLIFDDCDALHQEINVGRYALDA